VPDNPERRMTFGEHLKELRSRLIKSLLGVALALTVCLIFMDQIVAIMRQPQDTAVELLKADYPKIEVKPISGTFQGPFFAYLKLCFIFSLFIASPIVGYQMWQFIGAGLYAHEKKWVMLFAPLSFVLFVAGCLFGYFIMIPEGLYFMSKFSDPEHVAQYFLISEYLDLVTLLTIVTGAVFQIPIFMMFFSLIGLATWKTYLRFWRWAIVLIFVAAAVLTPSPDPLNQCLLAGPMLILYFFGVLMSALVGRQREAPATERQQTPA
jgi:Tat protein translocase TatC